MSEYNSRVFTSQSKVSDLDNVIEISLNKLGQNVHKLTENEVF